MLIQPGPTGFIFFILNGIFSIVLFFLFWRAVFSLLVYFNIINTHNAFIWRVIDILDRVTAPVLEPFRRIIPPLGGFDLSFIVAYLVIQAMQLYLLPIAQNNLYQLIG